MSKATAFQANCEKALRVIEKNPGITPDRLAVQIGLPIPQPERTVRRKKMQIFHLIKHLTRQSLIEQRQEKFAKFGEPPKLYIAGYIAPAKPPLFQPVRGRPQHECKTFTVPLSELHQYIPEKTTSKPASLSRTFDDIPAMTQTTRTYEEKVAAIHNAIEELQLLQRPFTQQEVLDLAQIRANNWIGKHPEAHQIVKDAVRASRGYGVKILEQELEQELAALPSETISTVLIESEDTAALKEQIAELEARNKELRSQLQKAQVQPAQSQSVLDPMASLRAQRAAWLQQTEQLKVEIQERQSELTRLQGNLEACDRLLADVQRVAA